jgi:mono/diheme cytochrome c family protein
MPAATNGGIGVGMSDEEIWQVVTYIRSVEKKVSAAETGDAAHGKELFYGTAACGTCHMVNGKGGRLGPDLSSVGSSRSIELSNHAKPSNGWRKESPEPLKDFPQNTSLTVVTTGDQAAGVVLNEQFYGANAGYA